METCILRQQDEVKMHNQQEEGTGKSSGFVNDEGKNGARVKVVLTKEELKWLILQLNEKRGMKLEQVLQEIERGREKVLEGSWKPSLESILEAPEMLEIDR